MKLSPLEKMIPLSIHQLERTTWIRYNSGLIITIGNDTSLFLYRILFKLPNTEPNGLLEIGDS